MTNEQKARLASALDEFQASVDDIVASDKGATRLRPHVAYHDSTDSFCLSVEVSTGREFIFAGDVREAPLSSVAP